MLGVIPPAQIDRAWPVCEPMLAKAWIKDNLYTLEDYKKGLKEGAFQLWTWVEDNKIACCGITCVVVYPTTKICSIPIVGGSALKMWKDAAQQVIADWAKKSGCSQMEGYAIRHGWLRVLPNWRPVWTTIRRAI